MGPLSLPQVDRYRKLPGRRRGILRGAGVWMGGDHLLSVKSYRFREDYKRFHLRDVQAIVVAQAPRFHISTRSLFIGAIWLFAYLAVRARSELLTNALYLVAAGLVAAWLWISAAFSCRCRILTAVSLDELPSIYRTWTARKFLANVEPGIAAVQGRLEGNWADAVESRALGPENAAENAAGPHDTVPGNAKRPDHTLVSDLFVGTLFANSAAMLFTLHSPMALVRWLASGLLLMELGAIAGIFAQQYRGILRSGMPRLAIAAVIKTGIVYYIGLLMVSFAAARNPGIDSDALLALPPYILLRQMNACLDAVLGLVGAWLVMSADRFTD
jgi:hypothetical protein